MALGKKPAQIVDEGEYPLLSKADHWERVPLAEVARVQNGFAFSSTSFTKELGMSLIRIRDIGKGGTETRYNGEFDKEYVVRKGDILVGMDGDFHVARWKGKNGLLNQRVCRITLTSSHFNEDFLFLCLQPYLNAINAETSSVTVKHLSSKTLEEIPLPYPPLPEQHRIVKKIEALFSELENGIEQLKTAQQQLKVYRQVVLKWAFVGKLTEEWREQQSFLPTAETLLEQIKIERKRQAKASGKKLKPIAPLTEKDLAELSELPEGWAWAKVEQIGDVQLGRQRSPKNVSKNFPTKYVRAANIKEAGVDLSDVLEMEFSPDERKRYELRDGDIVLSEASGSPDQVAKPAIWRKRKELYCFQNTVIRFQPVLVLPEYLLNVFKHFYFSGVFTRSAGGVGINHLSASRFSQIPISIPPLREQNQIVQEIESRLSVCDKLEETIAASLLQAESLRQSILKKAFEGKLAEQDPNDEPASVLLERIGNEKAQKEDEKEKRQQTTEKQHRKQDQHQRQHQRQHQKQKQQVQQQDKTSMTAAAAAAMARTKTSTKKKTSTTTTKKRNHAVRTMRRSS